MPKFKLYEGEGQEILISMATPKEKLFIRFDVIAQEMDLLEVYVGEHEILELIDDEVISTIKTKIFNQLKQENQQNYISAIAA